MVEKIIDFEIPKISPSIIMVAGVGGGGSNAVNYMYELGIAEVSFMVCNTDRQALYRSPVPIKVRLGENLTQGLGAGNNPERGREAAMESLDEIIEIFKREGTKMVFITAGMGGGTGTGAAPVIAKAARELGILTVAIVTLPFKTEGKKRMTHAQEGIEELGRYVDSLLLINNENIQEIYGKLTLTEAFGKADDILATAAKSIAEIITRDNVVNVDFADVQTVMSNSGVSLMGSGRSSGEDRAMNVANAALSSPLLNHNDIRGARNILINITSGEEEITLEETYLITEYIQERSGNDADIIWGAGNDLSLGQEIGVTIIATGFDLTNMPQLFSRVPRSPMQEYLDDKREEERLVPKGEETGEADEENRFSKPRSKWTPPDEPSPNIYKGFNRPQVTPRTLSSEPLSGREMGEAGRFERSISQVTEAPASASGSGGYSPLDRQPAQPSGPQVIERKGKGEEINMDAYENVPAFVRRNMKFVKDNPDEAGRGSRITLREENPNSERVKPKDSNSLFD